MDKRNSQLEHGQPMLISSPEPKAHMGELIVYQ